jgi:superfamily I DNA and/or RNA helicase
LDEKSAINQKLIDSIRVIGATCNHIAAKKYAKYNFEFDYVIMDESGKATTAEALVPIITGKNLIYVGDHRQLRPMLTSTREVESWFVKNLRKKQGN